VRPCHDRLQQSCDRRPAVRQRPYGRGPPGRSTESSTSGPAPTWPTGSPDGSAHP